jgi:saccharopine dehydrogenase-like NADP-dependent oxidoreductase
MQTILVAGSGQIGSAIGQILSQPDSGYSVILADLAQQPPEPLHLHDRLSYVPLDIQKKSALPALVKQYKIQAIMSSLPYFLNLTVAEQAKALGLHYFDLTEDVQTTAAIARLAENAHTAFVPQCGVAPGFINIVANDLMQHFQQLEIVKLRCGALPEQTSNSLQYALTWSIDGLINEYGNPCHAIVNHQPVSLAPLSDLEIVQLDGASYEAFNTSGGLGTLAEKYAGKVTALSYKTLRYPGHCEKMRFLMNDLKLNDDRDTLKQILLKALPRTQQDVVIVDVSVEGYQHRELMQESYFKKFYPHTLNGRRLTAIQMITASAACIAVDLVLRNPQHYRGFIHQAQFSLAEFRNSRFGEYLS